MHTCTMLCLPQKSNLIKLYQSPPNHRFMYSDPIVQSAKERKKKFLAIDMFVCTARDATKRMKCIKNTKSPRIQMSSFAARISSIKCSLVFTIHSYYIYITKCAIFLKRDENTA